MSENVEFDMDGQQSMVHSRPLGGSRAILGQPEVPAMSTWLMRHGIKSESTAKYVLLFTVIISVILTIVVYFSYLYTPPVNIKNVIPGTHRPSLNQTSQNITNQ